jgi:hypothetical protein
MDFPSQRIELPRGTHFACRPQLAFPNHMHEFDAGKRHRGGPEGFEPQRWPLDNSRQG